MNPEIFKKQLLQADELSAQGFYEEALHLVMEVLSEVENVNTDEDYSLVVLKTIHCSALNTLATITMRRGDAQASIHIAQSSIDNAEKNNIPECEVPALTCNILGNVFRTQSMIDKAFEFYEKALAILVHLGDTLGVARVTGNIGAFYADKNNYLFNTTLAEEYLNTSIMLSSEIGDKIALVEFHKSLADLYQSQEKWKDSAFHFKKYFEIKDELTIEETKKQDAIGEQQKVLERAKATADAKHQATQQLLHNVLPPSIANKMFGGTKLIAEKLPSVSVLFADIVNFTKLSQRVTPEELVEGQDGIFSAFDALAEKYGLEKIKTFGDAYMTVCGAPVTYVNHAERAALASLEMLEDCTIEERFSVPVSKDFRIGLHSGSVVAGIIGENKYSYDLWGDAVNTASRMESHGEPGKIHVSEEFLKKLLTVNGDSLIDVMDNLSLLTIHHLPLTIIPRGEMDIKGKGKMKTYFLEANL